MALSALIGSSLMAQVSVTFAVNMNNETVSENGVHAAGNWQAAAGFEGDWDPSTSELTDDDMDGIYTLTVDLPAGEYEFKYINGNDWDGVEGVPAISQREGGTGNDNRVFSISDWHATDGFTLPDITFGGSAPMGEVAVRLMIDMSNQEVGDLGVHVAGDIIATQWTPQYAKAWNAGNNKYAFVASAGTESTYAYKFINGNDWGMDESVPEGCAVDGNRSVTTTDADVVTEAYCYATCDLCAPQTEITLRVDMSNTTVSELGVHVAGSFQGWNPGGTMMTDDDTDGIYEVTLLVDQGSYQYKFVNGNDWGSEESIPGECNVDNNREIVVGEDAITSTVCFGQCTEACIADPDPAEITFSVNMANETIAAEGVWLMGGFTEPAWQSGAIAMTDDDADGVYTVTVEVSGGAEVQYKFANGDPQTVEEDGDFETGGCGASNGLGGFNRIHNRSGEPETLATVCYNSCEDCGSDGLAEMELGSVSIFPNPTDGISYITLENPNGYTLRMNILDITGKLVRENVVLNSTMVEINTSDLNAGLYFLNIVNEHNERAVYKLMVK